MRRRAVEGLTVRDSDTSPLKKVIERLRENKNRVKNMASRGYERGKEKKTKCVFFLLRILLLVSCFFTL